MESKEASQELIIVPHFILKAPANTIFDQDFNPARLLHDFDDKLVVIWQIANERMDGYAWERQCVPNELSETRTRKGEATIGVSKYICPYLVPHCYTRNNYQTRRKQW